MQDVIDRSSRYFIQVPNDLVVGIKNANAYFVYSILKTYTNKATNTVFPSRETIAKIMGAKTTKPVDTALKELRNLGLVATFPRWLGEDGTVSRKKDAIHSRQTSNGYIIYDRINLNPAKGWDDPEGQLPKRGGVGSQKGPPPGSQMDTPRVAEKVHEVYPLEVYPVELYKDPPNPQRGSELAIPDRFTEFYETYPRRVGKIAAQKAWAKATKKVDPQIIIAGAAKYAAWCKSTKQETRFIAHPSTWLNRGSWDDDLVVEQKSSRNPYLAALKDGTFG